MDGRNQLLSLVELCVIHGLTPRLERWKSLQLAQPSQGGQAWHEEVLAASEDIERLDPMDAAPDRGSRSPPTDVLTDDMGASFCGLDLAGDLVQELIHRLADALQSCNLSHRQIRMGDVPALRRDLVLN